MQEFVRVHITSDVFYMI